MENTKNIKTIEIIEIRRKEGIIKSERLTIDLLRKLLLGEIQISSYTIWDGFRNGLIRSSDLLDIPIKDFILLLVSKYDEGCLMSKKIILDLGKDPLRQNLSEEVQEEVAKEKGIYMKKLPQSGKNSLHVFNGDVVFGGDLCKEDKEIASKSLDFEVIGTKVPTYTYNKYNKWVGGSTDDVFKDVRNLIDKIKKIQNKSQKFIIILDGFYWDINRKDFEKYNDDNLLVISSDKLNKSLLGLN